MGNNTFFSIVIPAYNEEAQLSACLESINRQEGGAPGEIIIVDSNSTDKTAEVARGLGARVISAAERGVGRARRAGTAAAAGAYVLHIDADTRLPPNYLTETLKRFQKDSALVCLGGQFFYYDAPRWKNFLRPFVHRLLRLFALAVSGGRIGPMANNMTFKKDIYGKTRGFRETLCFGEDIDLSRQLSKFGKVRLDMSLGCFISVRRYRFNKQLFVYLLNFIKMCAGREPYRNEL